MLFSFLRRYGVDWDINRDAVAVGQGGIVTRDSLGTVAGPFAGDDKLAVKDPLTGVCAWTGCLVLILVCFVQA
jgi:hypothetical protein